MSVYRLTRFSLFFFFLFYFYLFFLSLFLQYNFVGRILGPRGLTAKQLEAETGCKIMVRGKSSMRDKKKVRSSVAVCLVYTRGKLIFFLIFTQYCESFWASGHTKSFPLVLKKHEADTCLANAQWLHPDI